MSTPLLHAIVQLIQDNDVFRLTKEQQQIDVDASIKTLVNNSDAMELHSSQLIYKPSTWAAVYAEKLPFGNIYILVDTILVLIYQRTIIVLKSKKEAPRFRKFKGYRNFSHYATLVAQSPDVNKTMNAIIVKLLEQKCFIEMHFVSMFSQKAERGITYKNLKSYKHVRRLMMKSGASDFSSASVERCLKYDKKFLKYMEKYKTCKYSPVYQALEKRRSEIVEECYKPRPEVDQYLRERKTFYRNLGAFD